MDRPRRHFFTLHELLIMAVLAALGGVSSSAISNVRVALHAVFPSPIGMQPLAGIHVLWLVIAVGLIRKPGAATVTSLLAGTVELLAGNPHGLLVVLYSGLAGVSVDAVWILLGGRDRPLTYVLAGGVGAASNVLVLAFGASLPAQGAVLTVMALLGGVSFVSGVLLAGLLGWWLLAALRAAGIAGVQPAEAPVRGNRRAWAGVGLLGLAVMLAGLATYVARVYAADDHQPDPAVTDSSHDTMPPG